MINTRQRTWENGFEFRKAKQQQSQYQGNRQQGFYWIWKEQIIPDFLNLFASKGEVEHEHRLIKVKILMPNFILI
jgi:hypothetical protein